MFHHDTEKPFVKYPTHPTVSSSFSVGYQYGGKVQSVDWLHPPNFLRAVISNPILTQFREMTKDFKQYEHHPPAAYVLYLFSYPWEMDENCNTLHFGPELKKYV